VNRRSQRLLGEIEAGALDQKTPISDLLRKVIALGGQAGSAELRDWATRELRGYRAGRRTAALPKDRCAAPAGHEQHALRPEGQTISPWELPEVAHDKITNDLDLRHGIGEIEQMARRCKPGDAVKLSPPRSQEVVVLMACRAQGVNA
jgi:AbiTii